jgi:hypothetical protein
VDFSIFNRLTKTFIYRVSFFPHKGVLGLSTRRDGCILSIQRLGLFQVFSRIDGNIIHNHAVMKMRSGAPAGIADISDHVSLFHPNALFHSGS